MRLGSASSPIALSVASCCSRDEDLEPLAERVVAEVVEARLGTGRGHELVVLPHVPPGDLRQ